MKSKQRDNSRDINGNVSLPERIFKGTFVVFTVIALLELPTGVSDNRKMFNCWVIDLNKPILVKHRNQRNLQVAEAPRQLDTARPGAENLVEPQHKSTKGAGRR